MMAYSVAVFCWFIQSHFDEIPWNEISPGWMLSATMKTKCFGRKAELNTTNHENISREKKEGNFTLRNLNW